MRDYELKKEGSVLTIVLGEELSVDNSPMLQEELALYKDHDLERVVFDATRLTYLSSSGVRVIMYCKKYMRSKPEIVFLNCDKDVLDVLDLVGIRSAITFK